MENLRDKIEENLPAEAVAFLRTAGEMAHRGQQRLYLVGGVVRDLLLERGNLDLDLVLEGDATALAPELARLKKGRVTVHRRFGTATVRWGNKSADLATARTETYAHPGALPNVRPGTIGDDLARRDFTINAMAVALDPPRYGELLDPHGGRDDLRRRYIRVLHEKSFVDDATRIWRALRYEHRLGFRLEPVTAGWLKRDIDRLEAVSGDRIRHELELVLKEALPERTLRRAGELGVLAGIHPALKGDDWLAEKFARARELNQNESPSVALYLALLAYRLTAKEIEKLIAYLKLPKASALALRETIAIKGKIAALNVAGLAPSRIAELLGGYTSTALTANSVVTDAATAAEHIQLYLDTLRYVNPVLDGDDLKKLGVASGPPMKRVLQMLRAARLDGKIDTRKDEEEWVRGFLLTG